MAELVNWLGGFGALVAGILALWLCIFVHELGHFWAARWRGLRVVRFSLFGLGPKLLAWKRGGVEYCICAIPVGAFVMLPQLADLGAAEGDAEAEEFKDLPPASWADKVIVAVAGPAANVVLALVLATVLWAVGVPRDPTLQTTQIGFVLPTYEVTEPDGGGTVVVPTPAAAAGLRAGDILRAIDGQPVRQWSDVRTRIITGTGRDGEGRRRAVLTVERGGQLLELVAQPQLRGDEGLRQIGVQPAQRLEIAAVAPHSPAERAGLRPGDVLTARQGQPLLSVTDFIRFLEAHPDTAAEYTVERAGQPLTVALAPQRVVVSTDGETRWLPGLDFANRLVDTHVDPLTQLAEDFDQTVRVLGALVSPGSDVNLGHTSGIIGMVNVLTLGARTDWRYLAAILILINLNLALLNLLPIPVLDGGHVVVATWAKLTGRPVPARVLGAATSVVFLLLMGLFVFIAIRDSGRVVQQQEAEAAFRAELARRVEPDFSQPAPAPETPAPAPAP